MAATTTINIRASKPARDLIDRAARASKCNRSEFMLAAAEERARQVLLDETQFALTGADFRKFAQILDRPLPKRAAEGLRRLLERPAPWEK